MGRADVPSDGALAAVRRLAGPSGAVSAIVRLPGGQHADTWRIDTENPALTVVVREFPAGDPAGAGEHAVLRALAGLDGLAPVLLGGDLEERWSAHPTSVISWLDGTADITPAEPDRWAVELARALAVVHSIPRERWAGLPSRLDRDGDGREALSGPLAPWVRSREAPIDGAAEVLVHGDYWSGNVVWRDQRLVGIVDWSGAARGPSGVDLAWCRLDLVLLFDERVADVFLAAYEVATGRTVADVQYWDRWALAHSHAIVETWEANYLPLGRGDLDRAELRRRHALWSERLTAG